MRRAFAKALVERSKTDNDIMLLTGDLGYSIFEGFAEENPERYFNLGIAEQNMVSAAAGLALCGKKPFVYSIIPYTTMRAYEQIRNDVCFQNANVKLAGAGSGLVYGTTGLTHHSLVDIAVMRALANMTVVCPADPAEAHLATLALSSTKTPAYIRLGLGEPIYKSKPKFELGKSVELRSGNDATLIGAGDILLNALKAADMLSAKGVECRVINMHTVKPLDKQAVVKAADETKAVFSVEEHSIIGGLGGAIAETLAEANSSTLFKRFGVKDTFHTGVGSREWLRANNSLSAELIAKGVLETVQK